MTGRQTGQRPAGRAFRATYFTTERHEKRAPFPERCKPRRNPARQRWSLPKNAHSRHPGLDPGPIGRMCRSTARSSPRHHQPHPERHPAAPLNRSRLSLRLAGMTTMRTSPHNVIPGLTRDPLEECAGARPGPHPGTTSRTLCGTRPRLSMGPGSRSARPG